MSKLLIRLLIAGPALFLVAACGGLPTQQQATHVGGATAVGGLAGYALGGSKAVARGAAAGAAVGILTAPSGAQGPGAGFGGVSRACQEFEGREAEWNACMASYKAASVQRASRSGAIQGGAGGNGGWTSGGGIFSPNWRYQ